MSKEQLIALKAQADVLGIKYSPNIGAATLETRISNMNEAMEQHRNDTLVPSVPTFAPDAPLVETNDEARARKKKDGLRLHRIRVICLDPAYKDRGGLQIQASNSVLGTIGKFIEFNQPWHMPQMLINVMKERKYQSWIAGKSEYGITKKSPKLVPTFAIEMMDSLTESEYALLQKNQAYANNIRD